MLGPRRRAKYTSVNHCLVVGWILALEDGPLAMLRSADYPARNGVVWCGDVLSSRFIGRHQETLLHLKPSSLVHLSSGLTVVIALFFDQDSGWW